MFIRLRSFKVHLTMMVIMTVLGLVLTAVFGASFGADYLPPVVVVDEANTLESNAFINALEENELFKFSSTNYKEAMQKVKSNSAVAAVVIKSNQEIRLLKEKDVIEVQQLSYLLKKILREQTMRDVLVENLYKTVGVKNAVGEDLFMEEIQANYDYHLHAMNLIPSYSVEVKGVLREKKSNFSSLLHNLVGFTLYFVTYPLIFNMAAILEDKMDNTFNRIMISPIKKTSYLLGSMIVTVFLGALQASLMILAGQYLFNIDWGPQMPLIILLTTMFIITMTCFGLCLSSLVKSYSQLSAITPLVLTSLGMLGGCMWPLEIVNNKILLAVANLTPHKWAVYSIERLVLTTDGTQEAYIALAVMALMAVLAFIVGTRVMKAYK